MKKDVWEYRKIMEKMMNAGGAAQYAGMSVRKNMMYAMMISGAFAGLAGAMEGLGTFQYAAVKGAFTGVGFDGIAVALLGGSTAIGVVLAACLLGGLKVGALNMPIESGVNTCAAVSPCAARAAS